MNISLKHENIKGDRMKQQFKTTDGDLRWGMKKPLLKQDFFAMR
jgi:hypothetical protein